MSRANLHVRMEVEEDLHHHGSGFLRKPAEQAVELAAPLINEALQSMRTILIREN
jgi:hypothetical protein